MLSNLRSWVIGFLALFKKPITVKYRMDNDERIATYERLRGELILDLQKCVGCGLCVKSCSNLSLKLVHTDKAGPKNRKQLAPQHNLARCTYCDICVEACPFDALHAGTVYDSAFYSVEEMIRTPEQLYEEWIVERGNTDKNSTEDKMMKDMNQKKLKETN